MRRTGPGLVGTPSRVRADSASPARIARPSRATAARRVRRFAHFEPGEDARLFRRIQNMPDLDAAAIESLLLDGARRRGMTVTAYRDLIQATVNRTKPLSGRRCW